MTISELIEHLKTLPQDAGVIRIDFDLGSNTIQYRLLEHRDGDSIEVRGSFENTEEANS